MQTYDHRQWTGLFFGLLMLGLAGCACHRWETVAIDQDCGGNDVGNSCGVIAPDPAKCTAATVGQSAVCWDGVKFSGGNNNPCGGGGDKAWCTYKSTPAVSCKGGEKKGIVYECK